LASTFILLHLVNGVCEMSFATGDTETIFNGVIEQVEIVSESSNVLSGAWNVVVLGSQVFVLFFRMLWFDYAFLTGDWIFLRFLFMAISLGIIVGLFLALRGTSSG
jgi:hypothetical protein